MSRVRLNKLVELLGECSPPLEVDTRLAYVEIQVDREVWRKVRELCQSIRDEQAETTAQVKTWHEGNQTASNG